MAGAISLPPDEGNGNSIKQSWNQARKWFDKNWNGESSEGTPLLNRERGTVEPPRKTTFRIVTVIVALVVSLSVLGLIVGLWVNKHHAKRPSK